MAWTKEKKKEWQKAYNLTHVEENRKKVREYYLRHREKVLKRQNDRYLENSKDPEFRKALSLRNINSRIIRRKAILDFLDNGKCRTCGFSDWRALHIDHVNSDGKDERLPEHKLYPKVRLQPERYQVLCANCNWIKRYEKEIYRKYKI
jgi:predicted Zn-ribbon and HTH transcriptional regulator